MSADLPIVQFWDSERPPERIAELSRSFARLNPGRPHIVFNARTAADFIAENFGEPELSAFRACGPAAMQADYLRYCALLRLGGIWVDAGFRCVRDLSPLLERSAGGELFESFVFDSLLMNGLLAFATPDHPFPRLAVRLSTGLIERRWPGKVNEITGPLVVTAIYRLGRASSTDAFLAELEDAQRSAPHLDLVGYGRLACELIGGRDSAVRACEGVSVHPAKCRSKWVHSPDEGLAHRGERHWSRMGSGVYSSQGRSR